MLREIRSLQNFGPYKTFAWPNSEDMRQFAKFNFLYGWNYSGKTTLSRLFHCLQVGFVDEWCQHSEYRILRDDASIISNANFQPIPNIRVFNTDYVKRSLRWDRQQEGADPVLLLGAENLIAQQRVDAIDRELPALDTARRASDEGANTADRVLGQRLTAEAAKIKRTWLGDRSETFDRPRLAKLIGELGRNHAGVRLDPAQFAAESDKFRAQVLSPIGSASEPRQVRNLKSLDEKYLSRTPVGRVLSNLQSNTDLNLWAKRGWELHKHTPGELCGFCGNALSAKRVQELGDHFSREYQEQLADVIATKQAYTSAREEIERGRSLRFNADNFYAHLKERAANAIGGYDKAAAELVAVLTTALDSLSAKEGNLFNRVEAPAASNAERLAECIRALNAVIKGHNDFGQNITESKEESRQSLIRHAASEAADATDYFNAQDQIEAQRAGARQAGETLGKLHSERAELIKLLDDATKGADAINNYLRVYFSKADLELVTNAAKRLEVRRDDLVAMHLSEGEKTAISFAHFLASLEEKGARVEDAIVFIDDPISSLDSNHLFGVVALIQEKLETAKQLFISTHSYEFFELLLRWRTKNGKLKENSAAYMVRKGEVDGKIQCEIGPLPRQLMAFRSEYVYLFSLVYSARENPMQSVELLTLPNVMRRFLEAFMHFKFLGMTSSKQYSKCFGPSYERVRKFLHQGSHETAIRSFTIPDRQETADVAKIVVDMVEQMDKDHFDGLKAAVTTPP